MGIDYIIHKFILILYFSILLHCIVQWVLQVMFLSACSLYWFSLSFTTCFGLHGHLQVCKIFYFCMLEGFCFAAFLFVCLLPFYFSLPPHAVTLCMFSICVLFLCCFPSLFLLFPCVCVCLQRGSRQTHTQSNNKNNVGIQHRNKTQMENIAECDHVKKKGNEPKKAAKQNPLSI
jgi:hypothetical protein